MHYLLKNYRTSSGQKPFFSWLNELADLQARVAIQTRLDRLGLGNFGNCESVGGGVYELKIYVGPGYRVYYAKIGKQIVLLLCGGSKKTQNKDIQKAKTYFQDYKNRGDSDDKEND